MMIKRVVATVILMALLLVLALPAFAGGTMNCGSGGYAYTKGRTEFSFQNQYHKLDANVWGPVQSGSTVTHPWGWKTGTHTWDVFGSGIEYESGYCVS